MNNKRICLKSIFIVIITLVIILLTPLMLTGEQIHATVIARQRIPWVFYTYYEPDFRAQKVRRFAPQEVSILAKDGNWALIRTGAGDNWVYTAANRVLINRVMPIYNKAEETMIGRIAPQVVTVLERNDNWLKIDTWLASGWVDLDFAPSTRGLENFMRQFGDNISVYYENLATGFTFRHNAEQVFFGASATKVNFALYIYHKAELGKTCLNSVHFYTAGDYWGGSGVIRQRYNVGASFTQRELLHLMLSPSDNIATRILRRVHGLEGFREFIESIGGNTHFIQTLTFSYLSADEAGLIMREIYRFIAAGGTYSHEFKANLLANRYPFIISDHPVGSKSGWASNFGRAYHDMAIVFAPSPYVLTILSNKVGTYSDRRAFEAISMFIQEFNDQWFLPIPDIIDNRAENTQERASLPLFSR